MDFNDNKPIYKQIVDLCHQRILSGAWERGRRVPSVRELGLELAVNSHTALKAYELLEAEGVISQRRGLGFYLADDAPQRELDAKRREFFDDTLPLIFKTMDSLGISIDDLAARYSKTCKK